MQKGLLVKDGGGVVRSKIVLAGDWEPTKNRIVSELPGCTVEVYDDTDSAFSDAVVVPA